MRALGAAATCVPVQFDGGDWEAAVFFQVGGPECKGDRKLLRRADKPFPVGLETDVIEHSYATIVMLRFQVYTTMEDPLAGEVLLAPGEYTSHFDTLTRLTKQQRLSWFFGDEAFEVLHTQTSSLGAQEHQEFQKLLDKTTKHDALVRMTARYDANHALSEITSRYENRNAVKIKAEKVN